MSDDATVERVARALSAELEKQGVIVNYADTLARAAIAAMPEPAGHTSSELGHG